MDQFANAKAAVSGGGGGFGIGLLGGVLGGALGGAAGGAVGGGAAIVGTDRRSVTHIGPVGPPGAEGPAGPTGETGAPGTTGARGPEIGDLGPTGAPGATGAQDPTSAPGATGPIGSTGALGARGPPGSGLGFSPVHGFIYLVPPENQDINIGENVQLPLPSIGSLRNMTGSSGMLTVMPGHGGVYKIIFRSPALSLDFGSLWGLFVNAGQPGGGVPGNAILQPDRVGVTMLSLLDGDTLQIRNMTNTARINYNPLTKNTGANIFAFIFARRVG